MARSMLSPGTLLDRASSRAARSRGLPLGSPPPRRAATVISLRILLNILPRRASVAAFLCLIVLHLLWPDMDGSWRTDLKDHDSTGLSAPAGKSLKNQGLWPCRRLTGA